MFVLARYHEFTVEMARERTSFPSDNALRPSGAFGFATSRLAQPLTRTTTATAMGTILRVMQASMPIKVVFGMRTVIMGTGIGIPKNAVPNAMLSKIMDTSDEWIRTRTGIEQRHYVDPGQGSLELGIAAAENALKAAKTDKKDIDA